VPTRCGRPAQAFDDHGDGGEGRFGVVVPETQRPDVKPERTVRLIVSGTKRSVDWRQTCRLQAGPGERDAFLADPPRSLLVSNVDTDAEIGGQPAVRFDLGVDPEATCQPDAPCSFVLSRPDPPLARFINPGVVHRIWWITDASDGGMAIAAVAPRGGGGPSALSLLATDRQVGRRRQFDGGE